MMEAKGCESLNIVHRHHALAAAMPFFLFGLCVAAITLFLLAIGGPSQIVSLVGGLWWHNLALVIGGITLTALVVAAVAAFYGVAVSIRTSRCGNGIEMLLARNCSTMAW